MELIQEVADLEREQDDQFNIVLDTSILLLKDLDAIKAYVAALDIENAGQQEEQVNKLTFQLIWRINFSRLEDEYICLKEIHSTFLSKVDHWIKLLDTDEEGNLIYQARGMPESKYNPDNEYIVRKASQIEEVFNSTRAALALFIMSLPAPEQIFMVQEAILPCLKNLDAIKAAHSIANAGD